ncbi:MAG: hypothetical protein ACK4E7_03650 [Permianibacter sp.]
MSAPTRNGQRGLDDSPSDGPSGPLATGPMVAAIDTFWQAP